MGLSPEDQPRSVADRPLNRRQVLGIGAAAVASTVLVPPSKVAASLHAAGRPPRQIVGAGDIRPVIRPRTDWASEHPVTGELVTEDDVRFLLVHHTASTNDYRPEDVVGQIRAFYDFHTGPEKGWPDVAYNFFVDRFGEIWEGREGSIERPIRGDATGGSQGFALLCSLIGNFQEAPVPAAQQEGLVTLLAWLGETYSLDTSPEAVTTFVSRGSSRWPVGSDVTASTISGHRDMSTTGCPGDFAYPLLADEIPARVTAARLAAASTDTTSSAVTAPATTPSPETSGTVAPPEAPTDIQQGSTGAADQSTGADQAAPSLGAEAAPSVSVDGPGEGSDGNDAWPLVIGGGVATLVAAAGGLFSRLWRRADDID